MKKRILSIIMAATLLVLLLSTVGCGAADQYDYSKSSASSTFLSLKDDLDFVYEETRLNLEEDGTWSIDMSIFLFFRSDIDEGTYTVENGLYTFEGFDYGLDATGKKTENGFEIYFAHPVEGLPPAITLYFVN